MLTGIDHVIVAVDDRDARTAELATALEFEPSGGGRHPTHGTYNRLFWVGDSYIELMGIFDRDIAARSWWGAHLLTLLDERAVAYAGLALASDDLAADIVRLRALGSAILDPIHGERLRPDGKLVRWRIARLPAPDQELGLTFLIEHDTSSAEWSAADRQARSAPAAGRLVRVEIPVANVARASTRLLRELGIQFRPSLAGPGARDSSIGTQALRLVPTGRDSSPTITIRAGATARDFDLLGCHWSLLPISG